MSKVYMRMQHYELKHNCCTYGVIRAATQDNLYTHGMIRVFVQLRIRHKTTLVRRTLRSQCSRILGLFRASGTIIRYDFIYVRA